MFVYGSVHMSATRRCDRRAGAGVWVCCFVLGPRVCVHACVCLCAACCAGPAPGMRLHVGMVNRQGYRLCQLTPSSIPAQTLHPESVQRESTHTISSSPITARYEQVTHHANRNRAHSLHQLGCPETCDAQRAPQLPALQPVHTPQRTAPRERHHRASHGQNFF